LNFASKSQQSQQLGVYIKDEKSVYACIGIHYFYYSCFQLMLQVIENDPAKKESVEKSEENKRQGSHEIRFDLILNDLWKKNTKLLLEHQKENKIKIAAFTSNFNELKNMRELADYTQELCTKDAIDRAFLISTEIISFLKKQYAIK
jgi:hypothetical protein